MAMLKNLAFGLLASITITIALLAAWETFQLATQPEVSAWALEVRFLFFAGALMGAAELWSSRGRNDRRTN